VADPDLSTPEKQAAHLAKLLTDDRAADERRYERDRAAADPVTYLRLIVAGLQRLRTIEYLLLAILLLMFWVALVAFKHLGWSWW
jgi:hypothetical protein